jgi:hypothetical protein
VLTRTIWVSCSSQFLLSSCTHDKFVMAVTPGHPPSLRFGGQSAHLHVIKILFTLTVFWLRSTLYRDTRNAQYNLYLDGKNCAVPSLHPRCSLRSRGARRDSFAAKVPGFCSDAASGNTNAPYCGAVRYN